MRSLALLMKLQLDGIFRFSEFRYAKSGKAKIAFFLRSLVPLLLAFVLYGVCYYLGQTLSKGGIAGVLPVLGYLLGSLLTLIFTMIKINELLAGDDNALFLLSLPISTFWHVFLIFLRLYVECTILVLLSNIPFFTDISDGSFCRWGLFGTLDRGAMFYLSADHRDRISGGYFPGTHPLFRQKQQLTAFDDHAGSAFCHGTSGGKFHRKCIQCGVDA